MEDVKNNILQYMVESRAVWYKKWRYVTIIAIMPQFSIYFYPLHIWV